MAINLRGAFLSLHHSASMIAANGGGAYVMMTSGSGQMSAVANPMQRGFALYGASKAALDRWALGVAPELAPLGIAINVLCPGAVVMTDGVSRLALGAEAPAERVSPERVADAIAYLAARRPPADTGGRFVATEFGVSWGRG
jgi:NAD(P)-dependent dehydrogenase (short-subunit alcohol dehydrogenase family)